MCSRVLGPDKTICEGRRPQHTSTQKSRKGQMGSRGQVLQTESKHSHARTVPFDINPM